MQQYKHNNKTFWASCKRIASDKCVVKADQELYPGRFGSAHIAVGTHLDRIDDRSVIAGRKLFFGF